MHNVTQVDDDSTLEEVVMSLNAAFAAVMNDLKAPVVSPKQIACARSRSIWAGCNINRRGGPPNPRVPYQGELQPQVEGGVLATKIH